MKKLFTLSAIFLSLTVSAQIGFNRNDTTVINKDTILSPKGAALILPTIVTVQGDSAWSYRGELMESKEIVHEIVTGKSFCMVRTEINYQVRALLFLTQLLIIGQATTTLTTLFLKSLKGLNADKSNICPDKHISVFL